MSIFTPTVDSPAANWPPIYLVDVAVNRSALVQYATLNAYTNEGTGYHFAVPVGREYMVVLAMPSRYDVTIFR